jgi:hypothetical protein
MGRFYSIPISAVASPAAAFDAFEIIAAAGKTYILHEVVLGQSTDYGDAAAEGLSVIIKRATGAYTTGSGGSTPTPAKHSTSDPAAGASAKTMNTTQAVTGSGALTTIRQDAFNIQGGYQYLPTPETRITVRDDEAIVVSVSAPADAVTVSGCAVIEELG